MNNIYLDHSATTPVSEKVFREMEPYFCDIYGNASSLHSFGQKAIRGVDKARARIAEFLNCKLSEVIFTSGATESDNLAIKGFVKAIREKRKEKIHIITSTIEHEAVLSPCKELEAEGVEITYLGVDKSGLVRVEDLKKAIQENTVLVSIMYANSEVGSIQPIAEIGKTIRKINEKRLNDWKKKRPAERGEKPDSIFFHTDATQAVNFCDCDVEKSYIDMLSMSAHKIYGPKGVGVLYRRKEVPMLSLQCGGHHENNLRSGTLNVSGIVGMGAAVAEIDRKKNNKKIEEVRDYLVEKLQKSIPDIILNTNRNISTPSHAHFSFIGVEGEAILVSLDLEGIAVSTGSACASGSLEASHVLLALGVKKEVAHNSIRFTLGKHNSKKEIDRVIEVLPGIVKKFRDMNPLYEK